MVEITTDAALDAMRVAGRVPADALESVRSAASPACSYANWTTWPVRSCTSPAPPPPPRTPPAVRPRPLPCRPLHPRQRRHHVRPPRPVPAARRRPDQRRLRRDHGRLGRRSGRQLHRRHRAASPASPVDRKLMDTTRQALEAGITADITAAVADARVGDVTHAVGRDRTDVPDGRRRRLPPGRRRRNAAHHVHHRRQPSRPLRIHRAHHGHRPRVLPPAVTTACPACPDPPRRSRDHRLPVLAAERPSSQTAAPSALLLTARPGRPPPPWRGTPRRSDAGDRRRHRRGPGGPGRPGRPGPGPGPRPRRTRRRCVSTR